ncbi:YtpI family protein [Halalkalibacterium ligniniphilum]|uniref:YtpI family protein n=2 Tax=Halalkalibacterium ligniniphilum TaxID=1134413 RepID=UPI000349F990|nr:YtpI family protein [Halalkalibacterium ligniniphilum]
MVQLFTIFVVISAVLFIFFKVRVWRTPESLLKQIHQTKANMALGVFLIAFGLNLLITPRSTIDIVVGSVFSLLGAANAFFGFRAYQHYAPQFHERNHS